MTHTLLVTGGAGFIGSHMTQALARAGHDVIVFDNLDRGNRDAVTRARLIEGDLNHRDAIDAVFREHRIDAVLHFAALAYVGESVREPSAYYRNNVGGTLNLLDAMHQAGVNSLVFSSTCATYGVPDSLPITEATPQRPINPYGHSKLMVEQILRDLATARGLRSVALRYFNAVGCSADGSLGERHAPETHLLPLILFEALRRQNGGSASSTTLEVFGNDFDTRDGTCIRDYIHVEDLCSAHIKALEHMQKTPDKGAEQYNLGTNQGYTVLEAIDICREITGVDITCRMSPRRPGDPPELVANASQAMTTLDWAPRYPDLRDGARHAWQWFTGHPPACN